MSHGDAAVGLPLLVCLEVLDENDKGRVVNLVVDLVLGGFAASHCEVVDEEGVWCREKRSRDVCLAIQKEQS